MVYRSTMGKYLSPNYFFSFFVKLVSNNVILQTFSANVDRYSIRNNPLPYPVYGRFVRLHIRGWRAHISMRLELYGCPWSKFFMFETVLLGLPFLRSLQERYSRIR